MKSVTIALLATGASLVSAQHACSETEAEALAAFAASSPISNTTVAPEADDSTSVLFNDVARIIDCDNTTFTVRRNGFDEVHSLEFFLEEDGACGAGNCFYVYCEEVEGTAHDHNDTSADEPVRRLQDGSETPVEHEHHYRLVFAHEPECCANVVKDGANAHHTCSLQSLVSPSCESNVGDALVEIIDEAVAVSVIHPSVDHPHGGDEPEVILENHYFMGCNHTHADFLFEQHILTFSLADLQRASTSCTDTAEGECLVTVCVQHGGDGHDHDHDDGHDHGARLLQDDGHDHGEDDGHDHGDGENPELEGVNLRANVEFYLEGGELNTYIVGECCPGDLTEEEGEHIVEEASSFCAGEEFFGFVEIPELATVEVSTSCSDVDSILLEFFEVSEPISSTPVAAEDDDSASQLFNNVARIVDCDETTFTVKRNGVLEVHSLSFFEQQSGICGAGDCFYVFCEEEAHDHVEGEEHEEHHYHLVFAHGADCCANINKNGTDAHHTCEVPSIVSPVCGSTVNELLETVFEGAEQVGVVHPTVEHDHGDEEEHEEEAHLADHTFVGCNQTHVDFLYEQHIFTYALEDLQSPSNSCSTTQEGQCMITLCVSAEAENHEHDHDHEHDHGSRRLQEHDHDHDDGEHDHGEEPELEGVNLRANVQFYDAGHELKTYVIGECCPGEAALNAEQASVLIGQASSSCDGEEFFSSIAIPAAEEESDDDDTLLIIGGVAFLGAVIVLPTIIYMIASRKKPAPAPTTVSAAKENAEKVEATDEVAAKIESEEKRDAAAEDI